MFHARWRTLCAVTAVVLAVLIQAPQFLHLMDERSAGIPVHLNSDEYVYLARVQEALNGRPEQASEAVIGDPGLVGSQFGLLEATVGTLFSWTGWRAATVLQLMDSVVMVGVFLLLVWFFRQSGFSRRLAYGGALFYVLLQLNNLNRPIHPGGSFLVMFGSLNLLLAGVRGRTVLGVLGAILLGCLVGVYVWSWTFAWAWWGTMVLWGSASYALARRGVPGSLFLVPGSDAEQRATVVRMWLFTAIAVVAALPFVWMLLELRGHPLYEEAVFRSGMFPSRLPESLPYSILFTGMAVFVGVTLTRHYQVLRAHLPAVVTVLAAFVVIHQQVLHGITFNFVSHYLLSLVLAATCVVLLFLQVRSRLLIPAALCAAVYLAAVGYDGRWLLKQSSVTEGHFGEQHLAGALEALDPLPRQTVLSDSVVSLFLAASTKHDVLHSVYLKNVLIPHTELAERYCMTVLALPPEERAIDDQRELLYPDAVRAFRDDPSVREREVAMTKDACARIDHDPVTYLAKYGVDLILWDEKRQPTWQLGRLKLPLAKVAGEKGKWSLWEL